MSVTDGQGGVQPSEMAKVKVELAELTKRVEKLEEKNARKESNK